MLLPGRILYAVAIAGFGVLCLAYVDFVHQLQPVPTPVPGYGFLAVLSGTALIAAGLAIMANFKDADLEDEPSRAAASGVRWN